MVVKDGFATNDERVASRAQTDGFVGRELGRRDREANIALLNQAKSAIGRRLDMDDVVHHPQSRTGEAARSALEDLSEAAGPAIDQAREAGSRALDDAKEGLNNATRSAACRTARAAEDADGIAANC
jgi:crotonobetainyl-CoA:carnitine CoA-transferase CaiB-like acyl-CoA transferase